MLRRPPALSDVRHESVKPPGIRIMNKGSQANPLWDADKQRWRLISGEDLDDDDHVAIVRDHAPSGVFPGPEKSTVRMVACLVPRSDLAKTAPSELRSRLSRIRFEHKASTPSDDDEYWLAQSPFDKRFYLFASCALGGGWPTSPVNVLDARPAWFDEEE